MKKIEKLAGTKEVLSVQGQGFTEQCLRDCIYIDGNHSSSSCHVSYNPVKDGTGD